MIEIFIEVLYVYVNIETLNFTLFIYELCA